MKIKTQKQLEKSICEVANELLINVNNGAISAVILDAELDAIECSFDGSDTVTIYTKGLEYITLTPENLNTLARLIDESEAKIYG